MMTKEQAVGYFPTKIHVETPQSDRLKYLFLGPPKFGKTTFFTGCPGCLLLAFEEGHMWAACPKIVITSWNEPITDRGPSIDEETGIVFSSAIEILEALETHNPYRFIIIDTVDQAVKMCTDYELGKAKIQHPSDGGDYGKGWDLFQTTPFRRYYNRLVKLGVGVGCTSHIKEEWRRDKFGQEQYRRESTLSAGIQRFIHAQSDVIINGYFGRKRPRKGKQIRDRIISFDGTDEVMAGTRIQRVYIPNQYISSPPTDKDSAIPWKQWAEFFTNSPEAGQKAERECIELLKGFEDKNLAVEAKSAANENKQNTTSKTINRR
jgi:AAA domain-containing protein